MGTGRSPPPPALQLAVVEARRRGGSGSRWPRRRRGSNPPPSSRQYGGAAARVAAPPAGGLGDWWYDAHGGEHLHGGGHDSGDEVLRALSSPALAPAELLGTAEAPVLIESQNEARTVGCTGRVGGAPHNLTWLECRAGHLSVCPTCHQVFALQRRQATTPS
ncbi:hypothetical protein BU14_0215s0001 [Porphyra umbilicalis]|uniref:Uncharacterized protein n=1 Tax=Porphyra umbilicalis TaxID=2786 RepID=A0A1X6P516_PORUM|nr:hypothetical protein BU14_0215s0001 [Porphyra umbilicalis]|eukprot:OSX75938.1 hypothetical protein BU14_0215s0001 [Porphyra umbilicalis]